MVVINTKSRSWWVVFAGAVGFALSPATVFFYSLGLFMEPLNKAFGWDRAQVSFAIPINTIAVSLTMPLVGILIDRIGPKKVIVWSMAAYGAGMALFFLVNSLTKFYLVFGVLGVICAGANSISYTRLLTAWFDRNRGLAIGLASSGAGAGTLLLAPFIQAMIGLSNWQIAYFAVGLLVLGIGVPIMLFVVVDTPEQLGLEREPPPAKAELATDRPLAVPLRTALTTRQFWLLLICFMGISGATNGIAVHLAPMVRDLGTSPELAALTLSTFGGAMIVGRLVTGAVIDRFFAPHAVALIFAFSTLAIGALAIGLPSYGIMIAATAIGFSAGAEGDVLGFLISRYFGLRSYARIFSLIFVAYMLSVSTFPYVMALSFQSFGSYRLGLLLCGALNLASVVSLLFMGPYPGSARAETDPALALAVEEA